MLFKKLFIFFILIIVIEQLFSSFVIKKYLPAFWGNEEIFSKIKFVKTNQNINTVFIGSSKVKKQVIPQVFDSITNYKTNSFNIGCNGLFIPESFDILNYLIDSTQVKNIIFEVRSMYHIYPENLHITRTIYYHTLNNYLSTLQNTYHSNLPLSRKFNIYSTYSIANIERQINFNFFQGFTEYKNFNTDLDANTYNQSKGASLLGNTTTKELQNDSSDLKNRAKISIEYNKKLSENNLQSLKANESYCKKLNQFLEKASAKKINLILLFPSADREFEFREIFPIVKNIKNVHFINLSDASVYPQFYEVKNNFETEHLNNQGSQLYSVALGKQFNKLFATQQ